MSEQWKIGKVEAVPKVGDNLVQEANMAYKLREDDDLNNWR